jgi:hypothetical protein
MLPPLAGVRDLFAALSFCSGGVLFALRVDLTALQNLAATVEENVIADAALSPCAIRIASTLRGHRSFKFHAVAFGIVKVD